MRKPKGKLVALLAGAVVVVLVAVGVMFWKDVYCHLFLDPRLVGRWRIQQPPPYYKPHYAVGSIIKFDRVGNVRLTKIVIRLIPPRGTEPESDANVGTYRTDGNSFDIVLPHLAWSAVYRVKGDTLTLLGSPGRDTTYHRVPDDS